MNNAGIKNTRHFSVRMSPLGISHDATCFHTLNEELESYILSFFRTFDYIWLVVFYVSLPCLWYVTEVMPSHWEWTQ